MKEVKFSANVLPPIPDGAPTIWGGNGSGGKEEVYSQDFLSKAQAAADKGHDVFAYLEGPCGPTNGKDKDGEQKRCKDLHQKFNQQNGGAAADTDEERWKPYTFKQLQDSGRHKIKHCEIDNLNNKVKVPMIPLLQEIKKMYDAKKVACRLVLKNIKADELKAIKAAFPTPKDADFISPFHIFEANGGGEQAALTKAMEDLKGPGAVTIMSIGAEGSEHYGSKFSNDRPYTCPNGDSGGTPGAEPGAPPAISQFIFLRFQSSISTWDSSHSTVERRL